MTGENAKPLVPAENGEGQGELFSEEVLKKLISVEQERIESANRRTDVARQMIEANSAADKRQYEYHMARLKSLDEDRLRRHGIAKIIYVGGGSFLCFIVIFLFGVTFFGSSAQSSLALDILKILGVGAGGYGIGAGLIGGVKKLLPKINND